MSFNYFFKNQSSRPSRSRDIGISHFMQRPHKVGNFKTAPIGLKFGMPVQLHETQLPVQSDLMYCVQIPLYGHICFSNYHMFTCDKYHTHIWHEGIILLTRELKKTNSDIHVCPTCEKIGFQNLLCVGIQGTVDLQCNSIVERAEIFKYCFRL